MALGWRMSMVKAVDGRGGGGNPIPRFEQRRI